MASRQTISSPTDFSRYREPAPGPCIDFGYRRVAVCAGKLRRPGSTNQGGLRCEASSLLQCWQRVAVRLRFPRLRCPRPARVAQPKVSRSSSTFRTADIAGACAARVSTNTNAVKQAKAIAADTSRSADAGNSRRFACLSHLHSCELVSAELVHRTQRCSSPADQWRIPT